MNVLEYFLELAEIDNVHPDEDEVLAYIKSKLDESKTPYNQDNFGNIVATIPSENDSQPIALSGHVDIAAPLNGRALIRRDNIIKTDGKSLLGGDDKTAVAAMLWLAQEVNSTQIETKRPIELIFTVGEESGLMGAKNLDYSLVQAEDILVFDWTGSVNRTITRSPAYVKLDVKFIGKSAHPAEWQKGINAGHHLMKAASELQQGELEEGVTFNIGRVNIGEARNQVPGIAQLEAELRSFDYDKVLSSAETVSNHFKQVAEAAKIKCDITLDSEAAAYELDQNSELFKKVEQALKSIGLEPRFEETYGCFDGNIFAKQGLNVVILGASFYNPHGPNEYIDINELEQMATFIKNFVCK
jgi:tripeptide aminopeptidase